MSSTISNLEMHIPEDAASKILFLKRERVRNSKKSKAKPAFVSTVGKVKEFGYLRPSANTSSSLLSGKVSSVSSYSLMSAEKRLDEIMRLSESNDLFSDDNDNYNDSDEEDFQYDDREQEKSIATISTMPIVESPPGVTTVPFSQIYQSRHASPAVQRRKTSPSRSKKTLPISATDSVVEASQNSAPSPGTSPSPIIPAASTISRVALTVRWIQLSRTLFQLLTSSPLSSRCGRVDVSSDALKQILQVLRWRVFSVISEIEFSALYKEYSARIDSALAAEHATTARKKKSSKAKSTTKLGSKERKGDKPDLTLTSSSQGAIWLARFREMLLIEAVSEPDLDLFVGLLLHEFNTLLVDQTISYRSNPNQLDTVDGEWITLTEELFFLLDGPGYGLLHFDEMFFFAFCLIFGRPDLSHSKGEGEELCDWESALSLTSLRTLTWQILRECGAGGEPDEDEDDPDGSARTVTGVCLPMFQSFLLRKAQGCSGIRALIQLVRMCLTRCARICLDSGRPDLAVFHSVEATYPVSTPNPSIVVPRIWQHAVLEATGFSQPALSQHRNPFTNPAILFLLSDAAYSLSLPAELDPGAAEDQVRVLLVQDQIRRCADSIFAHFKNWATSDPSGRGSSPLLLSDPNPLHGLMLSTVQTYLNMQRAITAALFDTVIAHHPNLSFGGEPFLVDREQMNRTCAAVLPKASNNKGYGSSASSIQQKPSRYDLTPSPADSVGLCEDDLGSHLSYRSKVSTSSRLSATPTPVPNPTSSMSSQKHPKANPHNNASDSERKAPAATTAATKKSVYPRIPPGSSSSSSSSSFPQGRSSTNARWQAVIVSDPNPNHTTLSKSEANANINPNPNLAPPAPARSDTPTLVERPAFTQNNLRAIGPTVELFPTHEDPISNSARRNYHQSSNKNPLSGEGGGRDGSTVLTVSDEEVVLLQQLLLARDPAEQHSLVERLRLLKLSDQITGMSLSSSPGFAQPRPYGNQHPNLPAAVFPAAVVSSGAAVAQQPVRQDEESSLGLGSLPDFAPGHRRGESDAVSEATASSAGPPSSIMELLQQGQTAGKYAQMLREILRKMSKDDSKVRLKALEDVIQLGNSIAIAEEEAGGAFRSADQSLLSGSGSPVRAGQAKRAVSSNPCKTRTAQTPGHKGSDISERERENQDSHRFRRLLDDGKNNDLVAYPGSFAKPGEQFASRTSEDNNPIGGLRSRHIRAQVISFDSEGSLSPSSIPSPTNDAINKRSVPGRIPSERGNAIKNSKVFGHRLT